MYSYTRTHFCLLSLSVHPFIHPSSIHEPGTEVPKKMCLPSFPCPLPYTLLVAPGIRGRVNSAWKHKYSAKSVLQHSLLHFKNHCLGTSLVVQWIRLHAPNAGTWVQSLVREQDPTCMPQLRVHMPQLRSPSAATKEPAGRN